jgi:hypothetical protein
VPPVHQIAWFSMLTDGSHLFLLCCFLQITFRKYPDANLISQCIKKLHTPPNILMFVPCMIRRSRNNQNYALICTTPLVYILAPTCFGSSLPSSGSFLDTSELLEIQMEWVVYHIMCGYVTCVPLATP